MEAVNGRGESPLWLAATEGQLEAVQLLVQERGADCTHRAECELLSESARMWRHEEVAAWLEWWMEKWGRRRGVVLWRARRRGHLRLLDACRRGQGRRVERWVMEEGVVVRREHVEAMEGCGVDWGELLEELRARVVD